MAFYKTNNVLIKGISACVPVNKEDNKDLTLFADQHEASKFIEATGVEFRHIVRDSGICTSDLCFNAAHRLMDDLN